MALSAAPCTWIVVVIYYSDSTRAATVDGKNADIVGRGEQCGACAPGKTSHHLTTPIHLSAEYDRLGLVKLLL